MSGPWRLPANAKLAIRTTVAALVSYAIAAALALPQVVWAVVTALVVLQVSVGATIGASVDRMAGTLGGAVVGAVVAVVQPRLGLPDWAALAIAVAPLALLAAVSPRLRIAPLTAAIILLAVPPGISAPLAALERILEIGLGTVVGLAAALLIFPARAEGFLRRHAADMLRHLGWLVAAHLAGATAAADEPGVLERQARVRRSLAAAESSGAELARERAAHVSDAADRSPVLRSLRRLRSDVALLSRTLHEPLPQPLALRLGPAIETLAAAFRLAFKRLASLLAEGGTAPALAELDAAIAGFSQEWRAAEPAIDALLRSGEGPKAAMSLPFAIETLRRDLGDFATVLTVTGAGERPAS